MIDLGRRENRRRCDFRRREDDSDWLLEFARRLLFFLSTIFVIVCVVTPLFWSAARCLVVLFGWGVPKGPNGTPMTPTSRRTETGTPTKRHDATGSRCYPARDRNSSGRVHSASPGNDRLVEHRESHALLFAFLVGPLLYLALARMAAGARTQPGHTVLLVITALIAVGGLGIARIQPLPL